MSHVFALTPQCHMLTVEALNIIIIIFDLTRTKDPTHDQQYLKQARYLLHQQGQYSKVNVR